MENKNFDWNSFNAKYSKRNEDLFESTKKILNSCIESANKNMETLMEANKKLQEEIGRELTTMTKKNQEFWSGILDTSTNKPQEKEYSFDGEKRPSKVYEKVKA